MTRRHPRRTPAAQGLTPESERSGVRLALRVSPEVAERYRDEAARRGVTLAALLELALDALQER